VISETPGRIRDLFETLFEALGPQGWWPAETPFETAVGAVLTQGTAWTNVERATANLREAGALTPAALTALPEDRLRNLIRPAGFFVRKARTLRSLIEVAEAAGGDFDSFVRRPEESLRRELLAIVGIGPETADSILLYAAGLPAFPVDTYARRVLGRHGIIREGASYNAVSCTVVRALGSDARALNEFHALILQTGKDFCRTAPLCGACPLGGGEAT
jgi:endonuclease-3 related protein